MTSVNEAMLRPRAMRLDEAACSECDVCEELAPGIRNDPARIPVTWQTLEAMSQCPTGAIRWLEGKEEA